MHWRSPLTVEQRLHSYPYVQHLKCTTCGRCCWVEVWALCLFMNIRILIKFIFFFVCLFLVENRNMWSAPIENDVCGM